MERAVESDRDLDRADHGRWSKIKDCTLKILVIDIGGTSVKILATDQTEARKTPSGPDMTPQQMVSEVKKLAGDWKYDVVSIGYPGRVLRGKPVAEPCNLGKGWTRFDFAAAFGRPVKVMNDATIQAIGSYRGGRMLFLGLGTGLGSTLIVNNAAKPMELGHFPYKQRTYEDYVGRRGLERLGKKAWRKIVTDVVARLVAMTRPDEVVLGGGNAKKLKDLPPLCRLGDNANAFKGGFRLWEKKEKQVRLQRDLRRGTGRASQTAHVPHLS